MTDERLSEAPKSATANAAHVIAGFQYQLLQSVAALVALAEDETLFLEVSEDFSVQTPADLTDYQVKNSQANAGPRSLSLQSKVVRECLERFWELSQNTTVHRRLVFMARGGAAVEREHAFPEGQPGLKYWLAAAVDGDTDPIRTALAAIFTGRPLGDWLATIPSDTELRDKLLRRVNWQLELVASEDVASQITDQLRPLFYARGWPVSLARQAVKLLVARAFNVASRPDPKERHLSRIDLQDELETLASGAWLAGSFAQPVAATSSTEDILVSELEGMSPGAQRSKTVDRLLSQMKGQPLVWIDGAHGVGKSTLARLMAHRTGGAWLILDLRPVHEDKTSALAAWRELLRLIADHTLDGIIIDDFIGEAARTLMPRLAALARTVAPGGTRIIVTSHQAPSPSHLTDAGSTSSASVQAPYFSDDDVAELVALAPAPPAEMIKSWAGMTYISTGGGHPVLVTAKLASLRARNWPKEALIEDIGSTTSAAIRLTRDEARRDLLASLKELDETRSMEAGELLRRAASVFDRSNEALLLKLAAAEPRLRSAGDAFAVLKGSWLEVLPHDEVRVSPLISDIGSDVPADVAKRWRRIAALHWLETRTLNERTLPLCFWNAFWGEHDWVLMKLCEVMQTMESEKLRAAAPILAPITYLTTSATIYPNNPLLALHLRHLQFLITDAVDQPDIAGQVAARFLVEMEEAGDLGSMLLTAAGGTMLMSASAHIGPKLRMEYALRIREAFPIVEKLTDGKIEQPKTLLPPKFSPDMDVSDFWFATVVQHINSSADQLEAFDALVDLEPVVRNRFIDAISVIYDGPAVFVNSGWSHDQMEGRDMSLALPIYENIRVIVASWSRPDVLAEIACAQSVILDEGLDDKEAAITTIESAIKELGPLTSLVRQKAKVLAHLDRHDQSIDVLLSIEDEVGGDSVLERGLALRDGGISAAKSGRFSDAIRLLDKARDAFLRNPDNMALADGILIEKTLAQWRSGQKPEAILTAAEALDAVGHYAPDVSRQAERAHQFARAIVGLMSLEPPMTGGHYTPPFTFGQASQLEASSAKLLNASLKPLADNWRILAAIEAEFGLSIGIDARSMAKQTGPLLLDVERLILAHRYSWTAKSGTAGEALCAGAMLLATTKLAASVPPDSEGIRRVAAEALEVTNPSELIADTSLVDAIQSLVLDALTMRAIAAPLDAHALEALRSETHAVFGTHPSLEQVFDGASELYAVGPNASRAVMLANGIGIAANAIKIGPGRRFHRDMMLIMHITFSLAQRQLGPDVARAVVDGWVTVLADQRFLLKNPGKHAPAIEEAINSCDPPTLTSATAVIIAAKEAVSHPFADGWFDTLANAAAKKLGKSNNPKTPTSLLDAPRIS